MSATKLAKVRTLVFGGVAAAAVVLPLTWSPPGSRRPPTQRMHSHAAHS